MPHAALPSSSSRCCPGRKPLGVMPTKTPLSSQPSGGTGMSAACRVEDHQVVLPRSKAARHACPLSNWFGPSHRFPLGSIRHNVPFPGGRRYLSVR